MAILFSNNNNQHLFLATGDSRNQAKKQVTHFINTTQLVVYQSTTFKDEEIQSGSWAHFWVEIERGINNNRTFCSTLLKELQETGMTEIEDLLTLQKGYPSKLLHILTHMLDGFIGVDSVFFNLIEDSHWVSESLRTIIKQNPENYWLVPAWHGPIKSTLLHPGKPDQNGH
jgi:hypothetical protein